MTQNRKTPKHPMPLRGKVTAAVFFIFITVIVIMIIASAISGTSQQRSLERSGLHTQGKITDRYTSGGRYTVDHLVYVFTPSNKDGARTYQKDIAVNGFHSLKVGDSIQVIYEKDHPENNIPAFALGQLPALYHYILDIVGIYLVFSILMKLTKDRVQNSSLKFFFVIIVLLASIILAILIVERLLVPILNHLLY